METVKNQKIAIVRLSALGDIVFALIGAYLIKKILPTTHITWIVEERFANVIVSSPFVDEVKTVRLKGIKPFHISRLSNERAMLGELGAFDKVLDLQGLIKSAFVSSCIDTPERVGYSFKSARESLASFFYTRHVKSDYAKNIVLRYVDFINQTFDVSLSESEITHKPPLLGYSADAASYIEPFLSKEKKNIIINLGASKPNKVYPKEKTIEIAHALCEYNVLLMSGSANDEAVAASICEQSGAHALPLLRLDFIKAIIAKCDLLIGGDTGITHIAWALNRPSVTIFGATPFERNAYATAKNSMVAAKNNIDAKRLNYDDYCIHAIPSLRIIEAAKRLLCK